MPVDDCLGGHERQVLAPAGAGAARPDPQQLVPRAQPSTRLGSGRAGQDRELMAQQQVLEHEVLVRACPGQDGREQEPEQFKLAFSIADFMCVRFCRPTPGLESALRTWRSSVRVLLAADASPSTSAVEDAPTSA